MLQAGADVNSRDNQLLTPLHYAASLGNYPESVAYLLLAGADYSAVDISGLLPEDYTGTNFNHSRNVVTDLIVGNYPELYASVYANALSLADGVANTF